jgi:hypothetical protein
MDSQAPSHQSTPSSETGDSVGPSSSGRPLSIIESITSIDEEDAKVRGTESKLANLVKCKSDAEQPNHSSAEKTKIILLLPCL